MKLRIVWLRFVMWVYQCTRAYQLRQDPARWTDDNEKVYRQGKALLSIMGARKDGEQ